MIRYGSPAFFNHFFIKAIFYENIFYFSNIGKKTTIPLSVLHE